MTPTAAVCDRRYRSICHTGRALADFLYSLFNDLELTIGWAAQRPNVYPVDSQLASRSRLNSDEMRPAAAITNVPSALEMNSPIRGYKFNRMYDRTFHLTQKKHRNDGNNPSDGLYLGCWRLRQQGTLLVVFMTAVSLSNLCADICIGSHFE